MERFLTKKALKKHPLDWLVMSTSFFFGLVSLVSVVDFMQANNIGTALVGLVMAAIFLFPGVNTLVRRIRVTRARIFARALHNWHEHLLPLETLKKQHPERDAVKQLQSLIHLDFIQGAYVDLAQQAVVLDGIAAKAPARVIGVHCPQCGASCHVTVGETSRCSFCGSVLPSMGDD